MRAAYAVTFDENDPLAALEVGERPEPEPPTDWVTVEVKASSLNHHDLWSLRGVGLSKDKLPMILGCDAAGIGPGGHEVVVHAVVDRSILSEQHQGTFAERVTVPAGNLLPKPSVLSFAEAACLPTAWLTAYRMLTTKGRLPDGGSVLVQGAGGGVATAAGSCSMAASRRWPTPPAKAGWSSDYGRRKQQRSAAGGNPGDRADHRGRDPVDGFGRCDRAGR
jgi:NADPH:quinone reductase-like Zn-dependent oxidoreductase